MRFIASVNVVINLWACFNKSKESNGSYLASSTVIVRSSKVVPFMVEIASSAASLSTNLTNPNPLNIAMKIIRCDQE